MTVGPLIELAQRSLNTPILAEDRERRAAEETEGAIAEIEAHNKAVRESADPKSAREFWGSK